MKPFKCIICDKKISERRNLKKHIEAVHEGIKAYACNICTLSSADKKGLDMSVCM